jgi:ApbE superfamily uncharacterized protein (UPF0280 family)
MKAAEFLEEVAQHFTEIQQPAVACPEPSKELLVHEMWRAASLIGDPDLTPMAAVAGTIADATADFLASRGLTRILVNNGGDVALRLSPGESVGVGIRPDIASPVVSHRVVVTPELGIGGVCTSGLGGRSFTRGVASAATVFGSRASVVDAAATALANATYIASPAVRRCDAASLFPDTDLKGLDVTVEVGDLTESEKETALAQAMQRAETLVNRGLIFGACVAVKGRIRCTELLSRLVEKL